MSNPPSKRGMLLPFLERRRFSSMPKISVILPTYNERENIGDLIEAILEYSPNPTEIIVVDDDSPDQTWKVVEKIEKEKKNVKLVRRLNERGLASALADGIALSTGDILIWMDCDFSHPPELIPQLVKTLENCDISVASRFVEGGGMRYSFTRIFSSRLLNFFANIVLGFSVRDYTSGYPAVKREVFDKVRICPLLGESRGYISAYGEYFISFLYRAKKKGFKITEIPYIYVPRKRGESKTAPTILTLLKRGIVYFLAIIYLKLKYSNYNKL